VLDPGTATIKLPVEISAEFVIGFENNGVYLPRRLPCRAIQGQGKAARELMTDELA